MAREVVPRDGAEPDPAGHGRSRARLRDGSARVVEEENPQPTAPAHPLLALQQTAGNGAVARLVARAGGGAAVPVGDAGGPLLQREVDTAAPPARDEATTLIDQHTSWGNLDEAALGAELARRAVQGAHGLVEQVLTKLGLTDRDDVSVELLQRVPADQLATIAASTGGRRLLDRLFDELTAGSVGADEQAQADRIMQVKATLISPEQFQKQVQQAKMFPFRLPGLTVVDDAPITAERRPGGAIYVKLPVRVLGTDRFRAETATLPAEVFTSGVELPETEIVGVRMYDLGGPVVYRPAAFLLQLANQTDTTTLTKIAEVAGIGLTLGAGELISLGVEASLAVRVLAWADTAAVSLGTLSTVVLEHRGDIIARFGDAGQTFVRHVEYVQAATALYGFARTALAMGQLIQGLRRAYQNWRSAVQAADDLGSEQSAAFQTVGQRTDEVLRQADQIQQAGPAQPASGGAGSAGPAAAGPAPAGPAPAGPAAATAAATKPAPPGQSLDEIFGEQYDFTKTDAMRDPVAHAHIAKLRRMALEALADSGPDQPVKVVPLRYDPATAVKGDFTQAKFVLGRTPEEIAQILGVTEFRNGVRVYRLDRAAITEENLRLRGYTQSPAGKSPSLQTEENLKKWPVGLGAPQWNVAADVPVTSAVECAPGVPARF